MKKILILGSTGSIGQTALELIRNDRENFCVTGLSCNSKINLMRKQIDEFSPKYVCVGNYDLYQQISKEYHDVKFYFGNDGLKEISAEADYDIILTAVSGAVGIDATVEAIKREKIIALANKETMVAAGSYINFLIDNYNAKIIPVDSEHSAIFQSIQGNNHEDINKIIITASGGTFRGKTRDELKNVTVEEALKHPNWNMGKKITVDSSTLMNKGLEVIEAHELFRMPYEKIEVVVHPQSVIHSMVEYNDGSIISQMGVPSMKTPILYALTYPDRIKNNSISMLDFKKFNNLTFEEVDNETFKGITLAYQAGKIGNTMPTVLNAANEIAVNLFLEKKIKFLDIYQIVEDEISNHKIITLKNNHEDLNIIKQIDEETRKRVKEKWER